MDPITLFDEEFGLPATSVGDNSSPDTLLDNTNTPGLLPASINQTSSSEPPVFASKTNSEGLSVFACSTSLSSEGPTVENSSHLDPSGVFADQTSSECDIGQQRNPDIGSSSNSPQESVTPSMLISTSGCRPQRLGRTRFVMDRSEVDARLSDEVLTLVNGVWMIPRSCFACLGRRTFCDRKMPCTDCVKRGQPCFRGPDTVRACRRQIRRMHVETSPEVDGDKKEEDERGKEGDEMRESDGKKEDVQQSAKLIGPGDLHIKASPLTVPRGSPISPTRTTATFLTTPIICRGKRTRTQDMGAMGVVHQSTQSAELDGDQSRASSLAASQNISSQSTPTPLATVLIHPNKRSRIQNGKVKEEVQENIQLVSPDRERQSLSQESSLAPSMTPDMLLLTARPIAFMTRIIPSLKALIVHGTEASTLTLFLDQVRKRFKLAQEVDITRVAVILERSEPLEIEIALEDERDWSMVLRDSKNWGGEMMEVIVETS